MILMVYIQIYSRRKMMKKKYKVTATEEVWYEKIVEAENEDEAYEVFAQTLDNSDIVEGRGFEVDDITEVKDED